MPLSQDSCGPIPKKQPDKPLRILGTDMRSAQRPFSNCGGASTRPSAWRSGHYDTLPTSQTWATTSAVSGGPPREVTAKLVPPVDTELTVSKAKGVNVLLCGLVAHEP